jgi:hypothetical protein
MKFDYEILSNMNFILGKSLGYSITAFTSDKTHIEILLCIGIARLLFRSMLLPSFIYHCFNIIPQ